MAALVRSSNPEYRRVDRRLIALGVAVAGLLAAFLLAPGSVATKTHAALHGLCAQRPSHSLQIGGATLPMDARMTGIYLAAASTVSWLAAARRLRAARVPSLPVLSVLALFVGLLAVDGFNALLVDLRIPRLYEPSNVLRLVTGLLAGTSLGVGLSHVFAVSLWARPEAERAVVSRPMELLIPLSISTTLAGVAILDLSLLYAPFALGLLVSALGVFWLLALVVVALLSQRGWSCRTPGDLAPLAAPALFAALVTMAGLSWLRFAAEQHFGLRNLT